MDAPIVQALGERVIYRASALGGCRRALLAARQGMVAQPPPKAFANEEGTGIFDRGIEAEDPIVDMLIQQGFIIHDQQLECALSFDSLPGVHVLGHIDGLTEPGVTLYPVTGAFTHLLEIKRFGHALWDKWKAQQFDAFPVYAVQVSSYMHGLDISFLCMVIYNGETGEFDISIHERAPREKWELELLVTGIEELYKQSPPIGTVDCTNNYPCPYYPLHDAPLPLPSSAVNFARAYEMFDQKIKTWELQRDAFKEKLREELPPGKYQTGEVGVTVSKGTQRRLDTDRLKALFEKAKLDINDWYNEIETQPRVTITIRRPKNAE